MINLSRLLLYRNLAHESILKDIIWAYNQAEDDPSDSEDIVKVLCRAVSELIDLSASHGYEGNLWHTYLSYLLAGNENAYSLACEIRGQVEGSINEVALNDFRIFKRLFDLDLRKLDNALEINCTEVLYDYSTGDVESKVINKRISKRICELARVLGEAPDVEAFKAEVTSFYKEYGVGKFGLNKAFRVNDEDKGREFLIPITATSDVQLEDLIGYEMQKQKLIANTEAFVQGRMANNVLLYGDAGTGKSTSIKAILNRYYSQGLRMIEVYKHQFKDLQRIISEIKNRNYRFIIYMDDLSFEEFEIEYKYLKAVIEGGLETKPENILIYATSNRRHLIKETWGDRNDRSDDEMHRSDTVQEKLSLVARFGVTIGYFKPSHQEYLHIVNELARRYPEITLSEKELALLANQWELRSGGASGRTAQQFINYLVGSAEK